LAEENTSITIPPNGPINPILNGAADGPIPRLDIEDELRDSYLTYAMSVIVSRALPDVRDGLKPSQRRILVAMNDLGLGPSSSTSKCAAIVGETMKRYHPHGDQSIYASLVRMAQDWVLRYRLVHGQGNFGSIAGLPAAAHRYTEARLTPIAAELLEDINRDTVDFIDNYDGKYREPLVLPSKVPNLLVNGSDGIAVGMATEIPPHNMGEICGGLIAMIDNPDISLPELLQLIPGPDFPTGGIIMGRRGIYEGYSTGRGKIQLRARAEIKEDGRTTQIIINEVPFQQTRNRLAEDIGNLVRDERIKDISAMRDESSARNGEPVRLVIDLKRGADPNLVLNQIYQFSPLQKTVSIILLALVDGRPRVLTLKEMMQEFIKHRVTVIRRRTEFLLRDAKRRGHILEGQLFAISSLDEVIQICRTSSDRSNAKLRLQQMQVSASLLERAIGTSAFAALQAEIGVSGSYSMTEQQSEAIVRMQLGQLAALERDEIFKEYLGLRQQIQGYEELLSTESNILAVVRTDLIEMRDKYGDKRKTEFSEEEGDLDLEDLIPESDQVVTLSHAGYIKRLPLSTYRAQHRGGRGVSGGLKDDDFVEHFFVASTHAFLLCFTNQGQCYWLKVYRIPEASRTSAGRAIANVLSLRADEKITSVIPVRTFEGEYHLLMATKNGLIKKTPLQDYSRPKQGGIIGINLEEGDMLISVCLVKHGDEIVLSSKNGMAIRFSQANARAMGRNTKGVKGINLSKTDEVVGMVVADPEGFLLTVCEKGYGKRTPFGPNTADDLPEGEEDALTEEVVEVPEPVVEVVEGSDELLEGEATEDRSSMRYRKQRRGGKGVRDIRTSERNGSVVAILPIREIDDIMLITQQGMVNRTHVSEVRVVGRNTQGVRVMNLKDGDRLVSIAKVAREEVEDTPVVDEALTDATPPTDTPAPTEPTE
jgi:DNA gyrase subunit A